MYMMHADVSVLPHTGWTIIFGVQCKIKCSLDWKQQFDRLALAPFKTGGLILWHTEICWQQQLHELQRIWHSQSVWQDLPSHFWPGLGSKKHCAAWLKTALNMVKMSFLVESSSALGGRETWIWKGWWWLSSCLGEIIKDSGLTQCAVRQISLQDWFQQVSWVWSISVGSSP